MNSGRMTQWVVRLFIYLKHYLGLAHFLFKEYDKFYPSLWCVGDENQYLI